MRRVSILEVSPRDGLQNEKTAVSTADKVALIARARAAGLTRIEVASFVNPKRVPQMADAEAVIAALPDDGATYVGLVLNEKGAERALATKVHELGAVVVASDTFAHRNQGQTSAESVEAATAIVRAAKRAGRRANITVSAAFGCPFEGEVPQARVIDIVKRIATAEPDDIALADTIGVADPWRVGSMVAEIRRALPHLKLRGHFHNTRNTGLANAFAAIEAGVETLDSSIGGVGGCPFAPAATGNVPTEDIVYMLARGGVETGIDLNALISTTGWLSERIGRALPAMVSRAGAFPASVRAGTQMETA
jgi:hydroxymethylglutaryl-CoA lyase